MIITLEHPSIKLITCWETLLTGCQKLSTFTSRIESLSKKIQAFSEDVLNPYFYMSATKGAMKFKGDVFEVFCELIIRLSPIDDRIGISDYHVITDGDTGCDGHGTFLDGNPATVQCKYRAWDYTLSFFKEHLANFKLTSFMKYGVDPEGSGKMLILTTGKDLHWKTAARQFLGNVRVISDDGSYGCIKGAQQHTVDDLFSLRTIVNDNVVFWDTFREQVGL